MVLSLASRAASEVECVRSRGESIPKAVVALAGARDGYQLPLALHEGGLLERLVTDLYWPADKSWFLFTLGLLLPKELIAARFCEGLISERVDISPVALSAFVLEKALPRLKPNRYKDHALSRKAKRLALQKDGALFCYSTYASKAFRADHQLVRHRFLFQLHPHPKAVRTLLMEESERAPWARGSLMTEYELALSDRVFEEMCMEPELANGWVAASSYTARTLTEQGVPSRKTHVVPYGVDAERFFERSEARSPSKKLIAVFVGSMIQRKGLSYFLDALRMLKSKHVGAVLCGRGMIDKELLSRYTDIDVEVRVGLSTEQLVKQIHRSDLFVLPSLAEGFAHVILEAMSCGVPVIATPNTCAPDVLTDGVHGFIVPIRDAEAVADKLSWAIETREQIAEMGRAAAAQARGFTWERFRTGVREAYRSMLTSA